MIRISYMHMIYMISYEKDAPQKEDNIYFNQKIRKSKIRSS